ncbi:hypothetical protein ASG43_17275 [Aureimonas sp. Leaf454]|uniref:hypothetical protein n=1 Tax=Aureimonas sp. Leaf454 TaxID=1736381 RepID=UPI0006F9348A|nr:hypothetical protein [Aureimonas sp. Leaf454]KQT42028.1 hypothetical protein ASG43_17275 [Aureimonas sp. Leaf454]
MAYQNWTALFASEGFIGGVLASILAAIIVSILLFISRNALSASRKTLIRSKQAQDLFEGALKASSPYAPFAFGIAQSRAIRYFLIAVFVAYLGDMFGIVWPLNIAFYAAALAFIGKALTWCYRIERRAMEIISNTPET